MSAPAIPPILATGDIGAAYMVVKVQSDCGMRAEAEISRCFPRNNDEPDDPVVMLELSIRDDAFRSVGATTHGATFEVRASTLDLITRSVAAATTAARAAGLIPPDEEQSPPSGDRPALSVLK